MLEGSSCFLSPTTWRAAEGTGRAIGQEGGSFMTDSDQGWLYVCIR